MVSDREADISVVADQVGSLTSTLTLAEACWSVIKKHSLMIARKDHIHHFLENLGFSKKLILLLIVSSGLTILLLGRLIENNFPALSFPVFLILFLLYLYIRIYNIFGKKVKRY